jgi:hypothetical protein
MRIAAHNGSVLAFAVSPTPSLTAGFELLKEPEQTRWTVSAH